MSPLSGAIIKFCKFVRENGLSGGITLTLAALESVEAVGVVDGAIFKFALRAALCSSKEEWDLFDDLFNQFWGRISQEPQTLSRSRRPEESAVKNQAVPGGLPGILGQAAGDRESEGGRIITGASAQERLRKTDFSQVTQADLAALEQISLRLLRQMSSRLSRRFRNTGLRGRVDIRRTIRRNISRGDDLIRLSYKAKRSRPDKLVILLDVSGSMNAYSLFLVRFAYTLQKYFRHVETFLFSTHLVRITPALRAQTLDHVWPALTEQAAGWSGGTRIGESLASFNQVHGRKLLSRDTLLLILSDGWETGEPDMLAVELGTIKRRVRKLIWLNPLLGMEGYQPMTRGMSAALPYIDVFAPAHNLESLLALEKHL
ncbi:MAG TPA: VWA domain-containing protein [Candidatus Angelobacter sp.]